MGGGRGERARGGEGEGKGSLREIKTGIGSTGAVARALASVGGERGGESRSGGGAATAGGCGGDYDLTAAAAAEAAGGVTYEGQPYNTERTLAREPAANRAKALPSLLIFSL